MESRKIACWQYNLISFFILLIPTLSFGENQPILMIKGASGSCSSGIATKGVVLTNAHVIDAVCPELKCDGLKVSRAPSIGKPATEPVNCNAWKVKHLSRALDLGVLECTSTQILGSIDLPLHTERASSVNIVSYPGCKELQKTSGEVTSESGLLIKTSAKGDYGSSGGGIYDADGKLIGIVDQATSARDLLLSKLTFQSKFKLRGIKINHANSLFQTPQNIKIEVDVLMQYFRESIRVEKGIDRLFASFDFLSRVEGLKRDVASLNYPDSASLLATSEYLRAALDSPSGVFSPLVIATILESKGFSWGPWRGLSPNSIPSFSSQFPEETQYTIKEILEVEASDPYSGVEMALIQYVAMLLVIILTAGFAIGWIFAKFHRKIRGK